MAENKKFDDMFSRLDTIHLCDGQTETGRLLYSASHGNNCMVTYCAQAKRTDCDLTVNVLCRLST